ncbi:DPP IV N-terminal domain-containing protein [Reichenbachiella sp.]|uniref:DPP IV N-terminal domain-containing protein n=1 Tax=Reichenbachiella sp. TaxID=2184521 RepID=UPI003298B1E5
MKLLFFALCIYSSVTYAQEYEILFTKQVNNNDNIYSLNHLGQLTQITDNPRKDSSPMLSPNGKRLVFTSERVGWWKIWLMDMEKNEFRQLTNSGRAEYNPSWSPDGQTILFVSGRSGGSEIYTMNLEGKGVKQLTSNGSNTLPSWATDGRIYYSSQVSGTYQVWSMKPDGADKKQLTYSKGDKLMAQLSPSKKVILYYGNQDGNMEIYVMDLNSVQTNRLTNDNLMDIRPRWSPDGKQIVFERGNKRNDQQIYIMDADGQNQRQLTQSGYNYAPSFAR